MFHTKINDIKVIKMLTNSIPSPHSYPILKEKVCKFKGINSSSAML